MEEYCYEEKCRYRHWTSGSVPTHRRGADCPEPKGDLRDHLTARLDETDRIISRATEGPWEWGEEGDDWDNNGPDLETVERGPMYSDGSQGAKETIISAWGHDAWGINIEGADAEFITHARTALPTALRALQAVMEVHSQTFDTPWRWAYPGQPGCSECVDQLDGPAPWPCPTIQKIQEVYGDE